MLPNAFKKFQNMYLKIYKLEPLHFLSVLGLSWQEPSKSKICK